MRIILKVLITCMSLSIFLVACQNKNSKTTISDEINSKNQVDQDTLVYDTAPNWSKTDDKIIFYTYRHDAEGAELYTISPDGTGLKRLTNTYHNEWWSDFSPADSVIYTSSDYDKSERFGGSEIFALKENGDLRRITHDSDTTSFNIYPRVSPDGKQLLYCSNCLGKDVDSEVYLVQVNGDNPINLSNNPSKDRYGSWSPDGSKILFESNRSGTFELYTLELATKQITQITYSKGFNNITGSWSINNEIVFTSDRDGDYEIFVMDSDGSNQRQITFNNEKDVLPNWSLDGSQIVFSSYRFGKKDKGDIFLIDRDGNNEIRLTKK